MLSGLKSSLNNALLWILGEVADIASTFSSIADSAGDIPVVGGALFALFKSMQAFFNNLGYDIAHFTTNIGDIIDVIDGWIAGAADLPGQISGEIFNIIAPAINLVNVWFDAIQTFFNDPLGTILSWLTGIAKRHEYIVLYIFNQIGNALFGEDDDKF